jgi:hypothetical protein
MVHFIELNLEGYNVSYEQPLSKRSDPAPTQIRFCRSDNLLSCDLGMAKKSDALSFTVEQGCH